MSPPPERVNEPPSREEVARLVHACRSESRDEQLVALERIESLKVAEAAPAVVEALSSGDEGVRLSAADALGRLGADASEVAGPALIAALDDAESLVRSRAAAALGLLGYRSAAQKIGELLESDPDAVVRADAAETLGDIGDAGSLSALEAAVDDPGTCYHFSGLLGVGPQSVSGPIQEVTAWDALDPSDARSIYGDLVEAGLELLRPTSAN